MKLPVRLLASIAVLLPFAGCVAVLQDTFIYFPDTMPLADVVADARRHGLTAWPGEQDYRGLVREPGGKARGTVVWFHGNAGHAGHRYGYADAVTRLGVRVILAEYPAYGSRPGKLGEAALVQDAATTVALARRQFGGLLVLAGESLGASVAAAVAKAADADALLLITPWDRIENVGRHHYPLLPVGLLLRDRYDNVANLAAYPHRAALIIAERDSIVPPTLGRRLYESLPGPKRLWVVPAADHNDWLLRVDAAWWQDIIDFLLES